MKKLSLVALTILAAGMARAQVPPDHGPYELRVQAIVDPTDSEDANVGGLFGLGYQVAPNLTLGGYGSLVTSDREVPVRAEKQWGLGGFGEMDLSFGYALMPYVAGSVGMLDITGPTSPTALHLSASLGVKLALAPRFSLYTAGTFHWASDDVFDFEEGDGGIGGSADDTDATIDVGARFYF